MNTIVEIYTEAVHDNLKPLFANWDPAKPIELGDYGYMSRDVFIHIGNIKDLGFNFDVKEDSTPDVKTFASKGSTEVKLYAKGSTTIEGIVNPKAKLEINFSSEDSVFFNASRCQFSMIKDKASIGDEVMRLYRANKWDRGYTVVTDLVRAGATTVAISGGRASSVVFEAEGDIERIDLADASCGFKVTDKKNVGYIVGAKKGLIPLIGLSKIQSKFLWFNEGFKPLLVSCSIEMLSTMMNSPLIQTEESPKDLYFGQIWD